MNKSLSFEEIKQFAKLHDGIYSGGQSKKGCEVADSIMGIEKHALQFDIDLQYIETIPQGKTNRCWLISAISDMLSKFRIEYSLPNFSISLNYLAFWDCMEKCNLFINNIILTKNEAIDTDTVQSILSSGIDDGGDWIAAAEIIQKYGVVTERTMPETGTSLDPEMMFTTIERYLKAKVVKIRSYSSFDEIQKYRMCVLSDVYNYLCNCCGIPTEKIQLTEEESNILTDRNTEVTPLWLAHKIFGTSFDNRTSILSVASVTTPPNTILRFPYNGFGIKTPCLEYVNLSYDDFKNAVLTQIRNGYSVPIACDTRHSGKVSDRIFCRASNAEGGESGLSFIPDRASGFDYRLLRINHCMLITGIKEIAEGQYLWKIVNSWASECHHSYIATDEWFDNYVFEATIINTFCPYSISESKDLLPNSLVL